MSERLRIAIVAGCLFVVGLHLRTAGSLLRDGWFGPYAGEALAPLPERTGASASSLEVGALADGALPQDESTYWHGGNRPGM